MMSKTTINAAILVASCFLFCSCGTSAEPSVLAQPDSETSEIVSEEFEYNSGGVKLRGFVAYDKNSTKKRQTTNSGRLIPQGRVLVVGTGIVCNRERAGADLFGEVEGV